MPEELELDPFRFPVPGKAVLRSIGAIPVDMLSYTKTCICGNCLCAARVEEDVEVLGAACKIPNGWVICERTLFVACSDCTPRSRPGPLQTAVMWTLLYDSTRNIVIIALQEKLKAAYEARAKAETDMKKEADMAGSRTGSRLEADATDAVASNGLEAAKGQLGAVGSAAALGLKLAAVDQVGEAMLDIAQHFARDFPFMAELLKTTEGKEAAKLIVALLVHSGATYFPGVIPKPEFVKRVAELQLTTATFKLVGPRLGDLRQYLQSLAAIGEQIADADTLAPQLQDGDTNIGLRPTARGRVRQAR